MAVPKRKTSHARKAQCSHSHHLPELRRADGGSQSLQQLRYVQRQTGYREEGSIIPIAATMGDRSIFRRPFVLI